MTRILKIILSFCVLTGAPVWAGALDRASAEPNPTLAWAGTEDARAARPHQTGLATYSVESGGVPRRYSVYVPHNYDPTRAVPAVLDLHGSGSDPKQELAISGMAAAAEMRGFVVILPIAVVPFPLGGFTWNVPANPRFPDDVRYVHDVLDDATQRLCVETTRVYATGFSGGARLVSELACALPDRIAAVGAVGGLRAPAGCKRPVPVVAFHGTGDPINPYAGGGPSYWGYSIDVTLKRWIAQNRCRPNPIRVAVAPDVERLTYPSCAGEAELTFYRLDGAGHVWPGSAFPFPPERFGAMADTVDATAVMLDFFARHRLPAIASSQDQALRTSARSACKNASGCSRGGSSAAFSMTRSDQP
jgi:polyhydroxybutyrate depolymerase